MPGCTQETPWWWPPTNVAGLLHIPIQAGITQNGVRRPFRRHLSAHERSPIGAGPPLVLLAAAQPAHQATYLPLAKVCSTDDVNSAVLSTAAATGNGASCWSSR
jgi:hypothetical protein